MGFPKKYIVVLVPTFTHFTINIKNTVKFGQYRKV